MTPIPRTPELLPYSVTEAARRRWVWGKQFPHGTKLEDEDCDRIAVFEAYEELLDCLNYLDFARGQGTGRVRVTITYYLTLMLARMVRELCVLEVTR